MKPLALAVALICFGSSAQAVPFVSVYGTASYPWTSPVTSLGACINPKSVAQSVQCSTLAALYHPSTLLPYGVNVGYVAGGALPNGIKPLIGPFADISQALLQGFDGVVGKIAPGTKFASEVDAYTTAPAHAVGFSAAVEWRPPMYAKDQGSLYIFTGPYYKF